MNRKLRGSYRLPPIYEVLERNFYHKNTSNNKKRLICIIFDDISDKDECFFMRYSYWSHSSHFLNFALKSHSSLLKSHIWVLIMLIYFSKIKHINVLFYWSILTLLTFKSPKYCISTHLRGFFESKCFFFRRWKENMDMHMWSFYWIKVNKLK